MVTIRVANDEVLYSGTLLILDGTPARIEVSLPPNAAIATEVLKLEFKFDRNYTGQAQVEFETIEGVTRFLFKGWKSVTGTALTSPAEIGYANGRPLSLQVAHYVIGPMNIVHINLMWRGTT
jgi:hypothetical protein